MTLLFVKTTRTNTDKNALIFSRSRREVLRYLTLRRRVVCVGCVGLYQYIKMAIFGRNYK